MITEVIHFVIRIMQDTTTQKWFFTVSQDAIRIYTSTNFDTKQQCLEAAKGKW